jgi:hypothetical protein
MPRERASDKRADAMLLRRHASDGGGVIRSTKCPRLRLPALGWRRRGKLAHGARYTARLPGGPSRYGLGAFLTPGRGGTNWWHTGSQPGEFTLAVRSAEGHAWVAAFNMRPRTVEEFFRDLDRTIWQAARSIREWPAGDLRAGAAH